MPAQRAVIAADLTPGCIVLGCIVFAGRRFKGFVAVAVVHYISNHRCVFFAATSKTGRGGMVWYEKSYAREDDTLSSLAASLGVPFGDLAKLNEWR